MTDHPENIAERVVSVFKEGLSRDLREQIGDARFDELKALISEALSSELDAAAGQLEDLARRLRPPQEKPDIAL